ncbi:LysR family transcriptional regulator [Schauerella aestuarii]|uniref:LysR family transcriptional regulator n=1 Tax=Schauerella aestuarii TaxID=2511204 RepID=UPI00192608D6|nr:LysR family transcriptional regulator [Achromobacter aestuarii]
MTKAPWIATGVASPTPINADRIELMQTFVRIVEAGSLSAAAQQLGTTQPTVSRRLQALERSLGSRLLQRSTHAMKLTEEGERCFTGAKALLASWEAFEADLRGTGDEPAGTLRVIVPHAFGQEQLVYPLATYLNAYPQMTVEWLLHDHTPDFIADGIDCAIQVGDIVDPDVVAIRMGEIPRIVVAAPSLLGDAPVPAHAAELARYPWLALHTFYRNEITLTHAQSGIAHRLSLKPRMSTDSLYALRSAAISGLGVCAGSAWLLNEDIASGKLVQIARDWHAAPLPVSVVYPYARYYPAKLRTFIEIMRAAMPKTLSIGR